LEAAELEVWSRAMAAGVPDEVFWRLTPQELLAMFERKREAERAAFLRAGLVAATIVNVNRRPGTRAVEAADFLQESRRAEDYMNPAEGRRFMDQWVREQNKAVGGAPPMSA